jgi:hypothetical protein
MTQYRVVCTIQSDPPRTGHGHILHVGTADGGRQPVSTVRMRIDAGDFYYTVSPSTDKIARVDKFDCPVCDMRTIRSGPDAVADNNLDNLPMC